MADEVQHLEVRRNFATPWLVNELTLTTDALIGIVPKVDPILGLFRTGRNKITLPLRTITSIEAKSRFRPLRLILAILGIYLGGLSLLLIVSGDPEVDFGTVAFLVFLPAGVWLGLQVYTTSLVIWDDLGGDERIEVSVSDRGAVGSFADAVTSEIADAHDGQPRSSGAVKRRTHEVVKFVGGAAWLVGIPLLFVVPLVGVLILLVAIVMTILSVVWTRQRRHDERLE